MASKEYLKKYLSGPDETEEKKIKKKKKKVKQSSVAKKANVNNLRIFDDDPQWAINHGNNDDDDDEDDDVVIVNEAEIDPTKEKKAVSNLKGAEAQGWIAVDDLDDLDALEKRINTENSSKRNFIKQEAEDDDDHSKHQSTRKRFDSPQNSPSSSPIRRIRHDSPDLSPPRKRTKTEENSPPTHQRNRNSDDNSNNNSNNNSRDLSPPRKQIRKERNRQEEKEQEEEEEESNVRRTSTGLIAGLRKPDELKEELSKLKKNDTSKFIAANSELSGRDQATIFRDKTGKKVDALTEHLRLKAKAEGDPNEGKPQWGGGKVQEDEREKMKRRIQEEKNAPFSRYVDDSDLNERQKNVERWDDPMAKLIKKTQKPGKQKKKCPHAGLPNRFNIEPGYQWDGIDRSNGFETKIVQARYDKQTRELEAYRDGTEDM